MSLIRGDALTIPLADNSVDLIVTSPPYFALRSYTDACGTCGGSGTERPGQRLIRRCKDCGLDTDRIRCNACQGPTKAIPVGPLSDCPDCEGKGGEHYAGQIGSEPTPTAFIDALIAVTRECVRVLKPSGSLFVNLGDKYSGNSTGKLADASKSTLTNPERYTDTINTRRSRYEDNFRPKSLMGLPWRYALRCIDDLGLILRAEIIWSKPNGLPESVRDRVRRSHEQWFHFTLEPRYFSAVDEIREAYSPQTEAWRDLKARRAGEVPAYTANTDQVLGAGHTGLNDVTEANPLGKLPGSVWTVPTEPFRVPDHLPQHFAAFPSEWPRRIILGWSPSGICCECGEGRRPVVDKKLVGVWHDAPPKDTRYEGHDAEHQNGRKREGEPMMQTFGSTSATITGESCACPTPTAPTRPAVVLDPFAGTGTSVAVANALGRYGVGLDLSADYLRLARWRCNDPGLRAKALGVDKPAPEVPGQMALL